MPGVITYDGLREILRRMAGTSFQEAFAIGLYTNNIVLTRTTTKNDLVEASFPGYTPQIIALWNDPVLSEGTVYIDGAAVTFSATSGGGVVYGYYVARQDGTLMWAENFGTPQMITPGNPLIVTPRVTLT